jgi:hypothetical protein
MSTPLGVPAGAYLGEFAGWEMCENEHGKGVKWRWTITSGEHTGRVASRITGSRPSPKNACGRILNALAGRELKDGESFDPGTCVGRKYMVVVQTTPSGATRVETVAPPMA